MGLRVSDWIEDRFVFMRSGFEHHTLNFARAPVRSLHHFAFELRGPAHMHQACDHLARHKLPVLMHTGTTFISQAPLEYTLPRHADTVAD